MKTNNTNGVNGIVRSTTFYTIAGENRKVPLKIRNVPYCKPLHIPLWAQSYFLKKTANFRKLDPKEAQTKFQHVKK